MPESMLSKKGIIIISGIVSAIVIASLFAISYGAYFDTTTASIPFPIYNGINIGDYFGAPTTGLSVIPSSDTSATNAPAITGCKITNDVQLVATDGTSYDLSNTSPVFSPTFSIVSNPYNGKTLSSVLVNVNLYCDPSTLTKYNYYPNLTGGTISVTLQGRLQTQQNTLTTEFSGSQPVSSALVNGQTVQIAQFSIPISQVSNALLPAIVSYYSQQNVVTTGILYFKQGTQSFQQTASHVVSPLYTSFSFLISPSGGVSSQIQPVAACPAGYYSIGTNIAGQTQCNPVPAGTVAPQPQPMANAVPIPVQPNIPVAACPADQVVYQDPSRTSGTCINLIQNLYLAGNKVVYTLPTQNYVIYSIVVNSWYQGQLYPTVKLTNLDTQTSTTYTLTPNSRPNNYPLIATSSGSLVITDDLYFNTDLNGQAGRYQLQVLNTPIGNYNRPSVSQDFVIYNPNPTTNQGSPITCPPNTYLGASGVCYPNNFASTSGTCPAGQAPTQTNYGLVCTATPQPNQVTSQPNSPVTLPTQSSNNVCVTLNGNSGQCVPVNNSLGNNPIAIAFQQVLLYFHVYG